jgi:hypothetical protein
MFFEFDEKHEEQGWRTRKHGFDSIPNYIKKKSTKTYKTII